MYCKTGGVALTLDNQQINLSNAEPKEYYFCCFCKKPLIVKQSVKGKKFFAHKQTKFKHSHNFVTHQFLQHTIMEMFMQRGIKVEKEKLLEKGLRADIFIVEKESQYVIEIQRTSIAMRAIDYRISRHQKKCRELIWIFPKHLQQIIKLTNWEQYLLAQRQKLIIYDFIEETYFALESGFKISLKQAAVFYQKIDLVSYLLKKDEIRKSTFDSQKTTLFFKKLENWRQQFNYKKSNQDILARILYVEQISIFQIPLRYYSCNYEFLHFQPAVFWVQSVIILLYIKQKRTLREIIEYCNQGNLLITSLDVDELERYITFLKNKKSGNLVPTFNH